MTEPTLAIAGVAGRMGRQLAAAAIDRGLTIAGATEMPSAIGFADDIGLLAGRRPIGCAPVERVAAAAASAAAWIDFTRPPATLAALDALKETPVRAVIIGTTGFSAGEERAIAAAAGDFAIVRSGNFSIGVNLLEALTRMAAGRLGEGWDIEILETHHRMKADAPSGTALMLGEAAAAGRGAPLASLRAAPYDGPDARREPGRIGFAVRRAGGVIGEHEVAFGSEKELIRLSHTALDRSVFADGAIHAALWAVRQKPGLYSMNDVLGLSHTG
ncbi:4-hydroxy-tetrahydrodipicolinate reductase [Hyphomonas sp.]|uniref:4-hydroxy-tetrahydrodipicolinate reductase n=1 Tax=Hyphomonas sp. TaxID=87 RepID=UPI00391DF254